MTVEREERIKALMARLAVKTADVRHLKTELQRCVNDQRTVFTSVVCAVDGTRHGCWLYTVQHYRGPANRRTAGNC